MASGSSPTLRGLLQLTCSGLTDAQFVKLCKILDRPALSADAAYSSNASRVSHRAQLIPLLTEALSTRTTSEWLDLMRGAGFPFAPVNNIQQTFEHPQAVARRVTTEVEHPRAGKIKVLSPAVAYNNHKMQVSVGQGPRITRVHTLCAIVTIMH